MMKQEKNQESQTKKTEKSWDEILESQESLDFLKDMEKIIEEKIKKKDYKKD